jgi:FkbM family methyltransferase
MSRPEGNSFRTKGLAERLAELLPSGGTFGRIRRRLKPVFDRVLALGGDGFRSTLPGGEVVLVSPAYRHVTWNADEYAALRAAVRPGGVVIDAGANVGAYTVLFAQWVGPNGRVFAFEPDPRALEGLERHVRMNSVGDRVTIVSAALADGAERRVSFVLGQSSGISRRAGTSEPAGAAIQDVDAIALDRFCVEHRITPDLIKIDVEGAELAVLRGARATVAAAGLDLHLFVEMHSQLWPGLGYTYEDLQRECDAQRLVPERLDGSRQDVWSIEGICVRLRPTRS